MAKAKIKVDARTFYLNEQHELTRGEKEGRGGHPKLGAIDWARKGQKISKSINHAREAVRKSKDPLREQRYFLLARPQRDVPKLTENKKKAPEGHFLEVTSYDAEHSLVFKKLGMDLIQVNDDGTATVHARPERIEQLGATADHLEKVGVMEQSRWATIDAFDVIPPAFRIDVPWLNQLSPRKPADSVIELQPLLTSTETDTVMRSISAMLRRDYAEAITGMGTDFSGRQWLRGRVTPECLNAIAQTFYSVQSLHSPLISLAATLPPRRITRPAAEAQSPAIDIRTLPCIAVLDTGVPSDHIILSKFRRGQFIDPFAGAGRPVGNHGSLVTSRAIFGDPISDDGRPPQIEPGKCSFYDVMIANGPDSIEEKSVVPAMTAVIGNAPDVRVFNISFDNLRALELESEIKRREKLLLVQDLDNFIFAHDVLVVVAAGNSPIGVRPSIAYPGHIDQVEWKLGTWSRCFNALTCGAFVQFPGAAGLATEPGAPSPFTRIGWGIADSPKPDFSEHGGNANEAYNFAVGLGVWACNAAGQWEDHSGTSFAAPLLARVGALTFQELQKVCEPGTKPYAVTVKAFLGLTANPPSLSRKLKELADRTLGRGRATIDALRKPSQNSAILVWQGTIDGPDDIVRVQLPIPQEWLTDAKKPHLRLVLSWDSPVNAAVSQIWASRKINCQLRVRADTDAIRSSCSGHSSYPLVDRLYDLKRLPTGVKPLDDLWLLEISYGIIADYYPGIDFSPLQRVAFAAELIDFDEEPVTAQAAMQGLSIAATMQRLSVASVPVRSLVAIKSRL